MNDKKPTEFVDNVIKNLKMALHFGLKGLEKSLIFLIRTEIYIISYVFYTTFGLLFYVFSGMLFFGNPGSDDLSFLYIFCVTFFIYLSNLGIFIWVLFRVPFSRKYLDKHFDAEWVHKMIGNPAKRVVFAIATTFVAGMTLSFGERYMENSAIMQRATAQAEFITDMEKINPGFSQTSEGKRLIEGFAKTLADKDFQTTLDRLSSQANKSFRFGQGTKSFGEMVEAFFDKILK